MCCGAKTWIPSCVNPMHTLPAKCPVCYLCGMANKVEKKQLKQNRELLEACVEGTEVPHVVRTAERLYRMVVTEVSGDYQTHAWQTENQLIRALNSVAACICEGLGYVDKQQGIRFYKMARGSAMEAVSHARMLDMFESECSALMLEVDKYIAYRLEELLDSPPEM